MDPIAPRPLLACGRTLTLGPRTLVMGILNVTPDSFSDGGRSAAPDDALATARRLAQEGADILDVGGESTRPGHTPVPADEEWARIGPVLERLAAETALPVSVDTTKASVARRALEAGAVIVNDVWGFMHDPDMARVVADHDAAAVVMHNRTEVDESLDIVADMLAFFARALERADRAGVKREKIVLDPGIGFGKSFPQNLAAIRRLPELRVLGLPLLLGTSRKSLIGKVIATEPSERLPGTIASNVIGAMAGVEIVRVHDVAAHVQALRVAEAIRDAR
ncbi:dihydropteroate synthase [Xanthobacter tagetidis]|jgi:dihydropteroate synthase|uniref:Dihydropteroate synthase n=1 Tax=Xanthobacter tagetidis TaxID=60216 RepID=A0A3L7ABY2_9HYPH|nr:dihydropteroate synthase [Xanthobacter tagetidis]MBB6306183.1 dihydropteroate synthase [Xanthobacter tagetidis]RLP77727.1 dihydropteroate synthase [Xanthobacter tagetidis]